MSAYELAKKYYPVLWDIERLRKLVGFRKLTAEEFLEITGEVYE